MKLSNIRCGLCILRSMIWILTSNCFLSLSELYDSWLILIESTCLRNVETTAYKQMGNTVCVTERKQYFFFHEGMIPRELLVEMKNEIENTAGINAAERYFYLLWKSRSLQSNDCGKRHDILISFNMKRNDSRGKHSGKPNKMYCLTAENNAIKKKGKSLLCSIYNSI